MSTITFFCNSWSFLFGLKAFLDLKKNKESLYFGILDNVFGIHFNAQIKIKIRKMYFSFPYLHNNKD